MNRILISIFALALIAAAPANRTEFVFDGRIPADNQQLLQQALTTAMQSETDDGATVIISLRVVEPEPQRGLVLADATDESRKAEPTPAERTR